MVTRDKIINEAVIKCLDKMYRMSQPSITWEELNELACKDKEAGVEKTYWDKHYLPKELYDDIYNEYKDAYRAVNEWKYDVEVVERYLAEGGIKDKWIEVEGERGYRGYDKVAPILEQIQKIIKDEIGDECVECGNKIVECVMNNIKTCKEFYRFDRDEEKFSFNVSMFAPSTIFEQVKKYHEENNTGIVIKDMKYNYDTDEYEYVE